MELVFAGTDVGQTEIICKKESALCMQGPVASRPSGPVFKKDNFRQRHKAVNFRFRGIAD